MIRMGREAELAELYALAKKKHTPRAASYKRMVELLGKYTPWNTIGNQNRGAIMIALSNGATLDSSGKFVLNGEARRAVVTKGRALHFFYENQGLISGQTAARNSLFSRVKLPKSGPFFTGPKILSWRAQKGRRGRRV